MERIGETLSRMRLAEFQRKFPPEAEPEPTPACPICHDYGFVRHEVPLDHADFGRAFPCACRGAEVRDRLRRRSNLGPLTEKSFEAFDPAGRPPHNSRSRARLQEALEVCRSYAEAPLEWLVLLGVPGAGKTHLAAAIANRQIELGNEVFFAVVPDLLDHLRSTFAPNSDVTYDEFFESVRNAPLLVLDDLGTHSPSPWAQEKLFQILNHRFNHKLPTVITSNHRLEEMDPRVRARLSDRTVCRVVEVRDWRASVAAEMLGRWPRKLAQQRFDNFEVNWSRGQSLGLTPAQSRTLKEALRAAQEFAASPERWLVFVGEGGRGKTHLAAAIKNERSARKEPTLFVTAPDLLQYLRETYDPLSPVRYEDVFEVVTSAPVLIVDDYGAHAATPWAQEKLFQLLNHRFNELLPTVITTNIRFDLADSSVAERDEHRVLTRLLDGSVARVVRLDVPRYRREWTRHGGEG